MEKLVVFDGNSIAYRAFYALPLLTNSEGEYTNAAYGFTTMLLKVLEDIKPDYVAVAFDKGKKVFRHQEYAAYKGKRKSMPEELRPQMKLIRELLEAMNIKYLELEGYEADDLIGSLVKWAEKEDLYSTVFTGDKDALQLISEKTNIFLTVKGISETEKYDLNVLKERYGLKPEQIIDLKGLMGDASDNIPGVPGVGEKTALKLLSEYQSIENLLEKTEDFSGKKLGEKLRENKDIALLSKKLATIECGLDLAINKEQIKKADFDLTKLRALYERLGFRSLLKFTESNEENNNKTSEREKICKEENWLNTETPKQFKEVLEAEYFEELSFYFKFQENTRQKDIVSEMYVQAGGKLIKAKVEGDFRFYAPVLKKYMEDPKIIKSVYDSKLLYRVFWREGIMPAGVYWDIMLGYYLLEPDKNRNTLQKLVEDEYGLLFEKEKKDSKGDYLDYWLTEKMQELRNKMEIELYKQELLDLYINVEMPLAKILALMELAGVTIDREQLKKIGEELDKKIEAIKKVIFEKTGEEFNLNSPKQLAVILFEKLKLPTVKKTKTGYSTDSEVLEYLAIENKIADDILEYRQHMKLKSTYVEGLLSEINPLTKKIHTTFNQAVTATGRLSSTEPNLQNIPIRLEEGRKIRKVFTPSREGYILLSADYSQIELRILAHMSEDEALVEAFRKDEDIHARTAAEIFGVPIDKVDSDLRRKAKAVNFGIVYGLSDFGLSRDQGISIPEAKEYIESYFARYSGVKKWIDTTIAQAKEEGFVKTILGRRRALKDIKNKNYNLRSFAERVAINSPIQGSASDIIKMAMINIQKELEKNNFHSLMLLQVHDELLFEVPPQEISRLIALVRESMEKAISLRVPLKVDIKVGFNWYEMEKI